jgi:hypothetical protein
VPTVCGFGSCLPGTSRCRHSIPLFNDICDAGALQSETARQIQQVLDGAVTVWVDDSVQLANMITTWCLPALGWQADKTLLANSPVAQGMRKALLSNEHYQQIGGVVDVVAKAESMLDILNAQNSVKATVVQPAVLELLKASCTTGRRCVVTTYCLFLLVEKLPSLSDFELKAAEVQSFVLSLKGKADMPADFAEALKKASTAPTAP